MSFDLVIDFSSLEDLLLSLGCMLVTFLISSILFC